jgi:DNA invertase Pin-like site-specific DNA recombinase
LTFADRPQIEGPTGRFMLQQMASVAELEAGLISSREAIYQLRPAKVPTRVELTAMCRNLPSDSGVREAQFDRWAR